jgi:hypothetical protein
MGSAIIIAPLKEGAHDAAANLVAAGPPFDPRKAGFDRHVVYLTDAEAIFVFEGSDAEWKVDDLVTDAFHWRVQGAISAWRPLLSGPPRVAKEAYTWERPT